MSHTERWNDLSAKFRNYHQDQFNIFLHMITTPLGVLSVLSLVNKVTGTSFLAKILALAYCVSIMDKLPMHILALTTLVSTGIALGSTLSSGLGYLTHMVMFIVGYFGQDLAHFATGEKTFQSSYQQDSNFLELLAEHTYYLLPLVFESTMPPQTAWTGGEAKFEQIVHTLPCLVAFVVYFLSTSGALLFPWQFQKSRVLIVKLKDAQDLKDLAAIRSWAISKGPSTSTSTHWWYQAPKPDTPPEQCLEKAPKDAFYRIANCPTITNLYKNHFGSNWKVEVLDGMNEVYVSAPHTVKNTSDEVFYTRHIDGPYYYIPFSSCFRMIIGLDANEEITTKFPLVPTELAAQNGDVLAFDFHREVHYIEKNYGVVNKDFRIVLKVHHVIYPSWAWPFGKLMGILSTRYNKLFRSLFLYTINPKGLFNRFAAWNVVFWTKVVHQIEEKVGYCNIGYIAALAVVSFFTTYKVFLVGTSFIHYLRYINTYYHREGVAYGVFKRDVFLFKALSISQLVLLYASAVTNNFTDLSLALKTSPIDYAMIFGGYALSIYTTFQLGVDGTYFGIELGFVKASKHYVQKFPYGVIPHPMILSQCVAMLGFMRAEAFRSSWPYLVPAHVCLYMVHMLQEHFDIYKNKASKSVSLKSA